MRLMCVVYANKLDVCEHVSGSCRERVTHDTFNLESYAVEVGLVLPRLWGHGDKYPSSSCIY